MQNWSKLWDVIFGHTKLGFLRVMVFLGLIFMFLLASQNLYFFLLAMIRTFLPSTPTLNVFFTDYLPSIQYPIGPMSPGNLLLFFSNKFPGDKKQLVKDIQFVLFELFHSRYRKDKSVHLLTELIINVNTYFVILKRFFFSFNLICTFFVQSFDHFVLSCKNQDSNL